MCVFLFAVVVLFIHFDLICLFFYFAFRLFGWLVWLGMVGEGGGGGEVVCMFVLSLTFSSLLLK